MKKLTLILLAFVLVASACKKDEEETTEPDALNPTNKQKGFAIEYTSTTCSLCGHYGGPTLHAYAKDAPHSAVIALHVNGNHDPMADNQLSYGFSQDRPSGGGIPSFWVADQKEDMKDQSAMKNFINAHPTAIAGIDFRYNIDGGKMTVETLTKFFDAGSGDYYLSVYVLEDGIDGSSKAPTGYVQPGTSQSYPNDDYVHDFVIRAASNGNNVMGEKIITNPAKDKEISKTFTFTLDPEWKKSLYPVAVLWHYNPNGNIKYEFVNAYRK
jgi:hypothetical protein